MGRESRYRTLSLKGSLVVPPPEPPKIEVVKKPRRIQYLLGITECPLSPSLRSSPPKPQSMLVVPRDESTFRESVEDLIATYDKLVLILLERFQTMNQRARANAHLFKPEAGNFRWELLENLCNMMAAGAYKMAKIKMCLLPPDPDDKKPSKPYEVFALDDALGCCNFQLRQIQASGVSITNIFKPVLWDEDRLVEVLDKEYQSVLDLPKHFGHCLEKTHSLLHSLSPAVLMSLKVEQAKEEEAKKAQLENESRANQGAGGGGGGKKAQQESRH